MDVASSDESETPDELGFPHNMDERLQEVQRIQRDAGQVKGR